MVLFYLYCIFIDMKKKLIITESQLIKLENYIMESAKLDSLVKEMKDYLDASYTITKNYVKEGGEYRDENMFKVNVSEELITAEAVYDIMEYKFKQNREFTEQVIRDWANGTIDDSNSLSKVVSIK